MRARGHIRRRKEVKVGAYGEAANHTPVSQVNSLWLHAHMIQTEGVA